MISESCPECGRHKTDHKLTCGRNGLFADPVETVAMASCDIDNILVDIATHIRNQNFTDPSGLLERLDEEVSRLKVAYRAIWELVKHE